MRRKIISKTNVVISLIMFLLLIFNTAAFAVGNRPDALGVDKISISPRCGIVEGKTVQMKVTLSPESASESSVEWYSSNPSVISCTEDGIIEGLSAGDYADITCKAKIGSKKETVRIYCVESIGDYKESEFTDFLTLIYKQPFAGSLSSVHVSRKFLYSLFYEFIEIISPFFSGLMINTSTLNRVLLTGGECQVMGRYGSFAYIAVTDQSTATDGFVKYTHLDKVINGFLNLSATDMDVWANGVTYENRKLTTTYKGEVEWVVGNEDYITFDETTGQIVGFVPGKTTTITAKADGMTAKCTIHLLYKWPQPWTAKTNKQTNIYQTEGNKYEKGMALVKGENFVVQGDCGTDNGWAYGYYLISDENKIWGYVPIADVSTKNTISYYNKLDFGYPIEDMTIKYISSPYAERSSDLHRGFDITGGGSYIYGKNLVSPVNGSVVFVNTSCTDNNTKPSYGYCITIESNGGAYPKTAKKDTVTGKYFTITFMHLSEAPKYKEGDKVNAGDIIGKIGNTGNVSGSPGVNPIGTHLHLEINNMGVIMNSNLRKDFTYNVNPIYFYMNVNFDFNTESSAYKKSGAYWYGPNN